MKYFKYLFVFIFLLLLVPSNTYATNKIYTRTKDNLLVPSDVVVDNNNIDTILKIPAVSSEEKIYDFADVLSDSEEKEIYNNLKEYIKDSEFDSVIVTTSDLKGFNIADYTYDFYDYNYFLDNGVIFVIYVNGNNTEIFMGNSGNNESEVFSIYSDNRINEILKYVYNNYISSGNYYEACSGYVKIISGFYNKAHGNYKVDDDGNLVKAIPWIEIIIISFAMTFILVFILIKKFSTKSIKCSDFVKKRVNYDTMIVKICNDRDVNNS